MFTVVLEKNLFFYLMAAAGVISIIGKLMLGTTIRRLTKAAENMSKSEHRLMKLIRAKYEHASMVSDKVQNVDAFVDKYLFEYKAWGLRLHTWRQLEKQMIWLSGVAAAVGAAGSYGLTGVDGMLRYYAVAGIAEMIVLYLLYQWGDEAHAWDVIHTYIVDYLENVCAHRMAKIYHNPAQGNLQEPEAEEMRQQTFSAGRMSSGLRAGAGGIAPGASEIAPGTAVMGADADEPLRETRGGYYELPRDEGMHFAEERSKMTPDLRMQEPSQEIRKTEARGQGMQMAGAAQSMLNVQSTQHTQGVQSVQGAQKTYAEQERLYEPEEKRGPAVSGEQRREAAREKVREAVLGTENEKKMDESGLAIQLDEARKNMEKDSEERKVIIREILEQYLA